MCLVCVAASSPEIVVVLGGYAATRMGRPVQRLRAALGKADTGAQPSTRASTEPAGRSPAGRAVPATSR